MSEEGEEIPQGKVGMENNSYASTATASGTSVISQTLVIIIIMSMVYVYHHKWTNYLYLSGSDNGQFMCRVSLLFHLWRKLGTRCRRASSNLFIQTMFLLRCDLLLVADAMHVVL